MAYNQHFKHDLFVSYARVDDADKRISSILGQIESTFKGLTKQLPKIWLDTHELKASHQFDASIKKAIKNSAIYLIFRSKQYSRSDYISRAECPYILRTATKFDLLLKRFGKENSRIIVVDLEEPNSTDRTVDLPFNNSLKFKNSEGHYMDSADDDVSRSVHEISTRIKELLDTVNECTDPFSELRNIRLFIANTSTHLKSTIDSIRDTIKSIENHYIKYKINIEVEFGLPPVDKSSRMRLKDDEHLFYLNHCGDYFEIVMHLFGLHPGAELDSQSEGRHADQIQYGHFKLQKCFDIMWIWIERNAFNVAENDPNSEDGHLRFLSDVISFKDRVSNLAGWEERKLEFQTDTANDFRRSIEDSLTSFIDKTYLINRRENCVCLHTRNDSMVLASDINLELDHRKFDVRLYKKKELRSSAENEEYLQSAMANASKYIVVYDDEKRENWLCQTINLTNQLIKFDKFGIKCIIYSTIEVDEGEISKKIDSNIFFVYSIEELLDVIS